MKLIVGLGNPGAEYDNTRHNFGFFFMDKLVEEFADSACIFAKKFNAEVTEGRIDGERVIFAKPQTFYNDSGQSARAIADFYKIPHENILAIHDEMDLPFGTIRTRFGGSDAGNNGVKSLNAHLGPNFSRIRIGSGKKNAENGNSKPAAARQMGYVLGKISAGEIETLENLAPKVREIAEGFAKDKFVETTIKV